MKQRQVLVLLFLMLLVFSLTGCRKEETKLKVLVPNGTPLIAVAGVEMDEVELENVSGPSLLTSAMSSRSHDIIIAPITTGMQLYLKKASSYKLASIITFSNVYLASRTPISSVEELENKKIVAYGQNTTPGILLSEALKGINASVNYVGSVNEAVAVFQNSSESYDCMLTAEPTLSTMELKFDQKLYTLDLSLVLKDQLPLVPQAGILVNPNSKNPKLIKAYLEKVEKNIETLNENPETYANKVVGKNDFLKQMGTFTISTSIPKSHILYVVAKESKNELKIYAEWLISYQSEILAGVPDENFYY